MMAMASDRAAAAYCVLDSPFGRVLLAATKRGIVGAGVDDEARFTKDLATRLEGPVVRDGPEAPEGAGAMLGRARAQLMDFFAGRRKGFDLPIDLRGVPDWDRRVLEATRSVPYGEVTSYGRLAAMIGMPRAARAVGGALGRNPVWILVPCHRVVAGDGSLGGYGGGLGALDVKRALLASEGVSLPARRFVG